MLIGGGFREWLGKDHAKRNVGNLLRNAKKYNDVLACLDWEWIGVKPEVGEAYKLLRAVAEWVQRSKIESAIKVVEPGMGARKVKSKCRWIECY